MGFLIAVFFGGLAALTTPLLVKETPGAFGGLLKGTPLHVPYLDTTLSWSWFVFLAVTALIWGLLKLAGK